MPASDRKIKVFLKEDINCVIFVSQYFIGWKQTNANRAKILYLVTQSFSGSLKLKFFPGKPP